jgi:hypothetical protein
MVRARIRRLPQPVDASAALVDADSLDFAPEPN